MIGCVVYSVTPEAVSRFLRQLDPRSQLKEIVDRLLINSVIESGDDRRSIYNDKSSAADVWNDVDDLPSKRAVTFGQRLELAPPMVSGTGAEQVQPSWRETTGPGRKVMRYGR